jgi:STE24 endopeptidase
VSLATQARRFFSAGEIERARSYNRPLYAYSAVRGAVGFVFIVAVAFSTVEDWLVAPVERLPRWAFALSFAALVVLFGAMLRLPFGLWRHRYERRWGFSTQSVHGWLGDWIKGLGVSIVLTSLAFLGLVETAAWIPESWPLVVAPAAAGLVVILSFIAPVVLEPVFNRFQPLEDPVLADELLGLSSRAGVPVRSVLVSDASRRTTKHNAYVSGLGSTRRVVVFDTLLRDGTPRDVRLVVAHELGHRSGRHVAIGTGLAAAAAVLGVAVLWLALRSPVALEAIGAAGAADPRVVPFVVFLSAVGGLVTLPMASAVSRRWERDADRTSVALTGDREGFADMMRRLALANLSDLAPPRAAYLLLFSHPTPADRIAAALSGSSPP